MDKKVLFNETLTSLVEFAAANGNEITNDDVKLYFKDLIEDEKQYDFINEYLTLNQIVVKGYTANQTNLFQQDSLDNATESSSNVGSDSVATQKLNAISSDDKLSDNLDSNNQSDDIVESEEELAFVKMYMEEMKSIPSAKDGEIEQLTDELLKGNLSVKDRLIECNLALVADIAEIYRNKGVHYGDLIQEGNLGLMMAIAEYNSDCGDFNTFVKNRIMSTIEETINDQINSSRVGTHLADKLNRLDEVTKLLSEKLGRVPDIKELAESMSISEDEASQLLKISLDTLSVNEDTQIAEESDADSQSVASDYESTENDPLEWRVNKK